MQRSKRSPQPELTGLPAFADDLGLCVEALGGDPGLYSARWAGPDKELFAAMTRIEHLLQEKGAVSPDARRAYFISALSIIGLMAMKEAIEGRV